MEQQLERLVALQGTWSATANRLKQVQQQMRFVTFLLTIGGAVAAAAASQLDDPWRKAAAILSAALFTVGAAISARFLGPQRAALWTRARNAAEVLKSTAWRYAAFAAPYDNPATRERRLLADIRKTEDGVDDLLGHRVDSATGSGPTTAAEPAAYVDRRVQGSIAWYLKSATANEATVATWRKAELALSIFTAVLAIVISNMPKDPAHGAHLFDWAAVSAVLTTITGAILAHIEAMRYDTLIVGYRAAARRLGDELAEAPAPLPTAADLPSPAWSAFVERCEAVIAQENGSWTAKFSKG